MFLPKCRLNLKCRTAWEGWEDTNLACLFIYLFILHSAPSVTQSNLWTSWHYLHCLSMDFNKSKNFILPSFQSRAIATVTQTTHCVQRIKGWAGHQTIPKKFNAVVAIPKRKLGAKEGFEMRFLVFKLKWISPSLYVDLCWSPWMDIVCLLFQFSCHAKVCILSE